MKRLGLVVIASALALGVGCDDDGSGDAGPGIMVDSGPPMGTDAGPREDAGPPPACNSVGRSGGLCRMQTQCVTGLECFGELSAMGMPLTFGNTFMIQTGELDATAAYPEYTPTGPSPVRINVVPGGLCTEGCNTDADTDTCGECSFCNSEIGGGPSYAAIFSVGTFDVGDIIGAGEDGVCRARCQYDPDTNGGCPMGHTCDRFTNTCLESCLSDEMCNLTFGDSQAEGLVVIEREGSPFSCNTTTGQCEWTAPATAAFGSECEGNWECAEGTGLCYFGRCTETNCITTVDGTRMQGPGTCPAQGAVCADSGGNDANFCLGLCNTAEDCPADHACSPLMPPATDGMGTMFPGICVGPCENDNECQTSRRCDATTQRFQNPDLGICNEFCDPMGMGMGLAGAVTCDATLGEICEPVEGENYGFCKSQNRLCANNESCNGSQRCRLVSNDGLGRCEDSCETSADCDAAAMEECVIVDTDPDDGFTENRGVCIAPGGPCSPSPRSAATGMALSPLRGLDGSAQCISTQTCDAPVDAMGMPMVDAVGTCVDI